MLLALAILAIFAAAAVLMYLNRLPALIALPLMAVAIAVVARVPAREVAGVVSDGSVLLHKAIITAILGAILAELVAKTGIAETMVKKAAELGGDRPLVLSLVLTGVVAVLFTTLGGLGAVIMVATIVFPILLALGLPPLVVGGLFLFGMSIGGIFNVINWQVYKDVLHLSTATIVSFALPFTGVMLVALVAFAMIEMRPSRMRRYWAATSTPGKVTFAPWYSLFTPVIPLLPILGFTLYNRFAHPAKPFDFPIITAMLLGICYGLITAPRPAQGRIQLLARSAVDGIAAVAPAVALMLGIGMVVQAVTNPLVQTQVAPVLKAVLPHGPVLYVVVFSVLAPLALYRGPLNLYGLGAGLSAMMATSGLGAPAVMAALLSVGQLQGVSDPTNTHNVWIANYVGVDVQQILRRTVVYVWPAAVVGLLLAAAMFVR